MHRRTENRAAPAMFATTPAMPYGCDIAGAAYQCQHQRPRRRAAFVAAVRRIPTFPRRLQNEPGRGQGSDRTSLSTVRP